MAWRIEFERAAAREFDKLCSQSAGRSLRFLRDRVAPLDDTRSTGRALKGDRFGDYRVIAWIDDAAVLILVLRIGHRPEVYR